MESKAEGVEMKITTFEQFKRACIRGAWRGLRSQNFQPSRRDGVCCYRGENGACCAIGWLCVRVDVDKNNNVFWALSRRDIELSPPLQDFYTSANGEEKEAILLFLDSLQTVHDDADTAAEVRENMKGFAARREVDLPPDNEIFENGEFRQPDAA
jgi:hypothetical protein